MKLVNCNWRNKNIFGFYIDREGIFIFFRYRTIGIKYGEE